MALAMTENAMDNTPQIAATVRIPSIGALALATITRVTMATNSVHRTIHNAFSILASSLIAFSCFAPPLTEVSADDCCVSTDILRYLVDPEDYLSRL